MLGIDPGYDRLGVAVVEIKNGKETVLHSCCIETNKKDSLPQRLHAAGIALEQIITVHKPTGIGIETLFFNKNVKTAMGVAQARGMILYLALKANCIIYELSPQAVKIAITGYGNSDKKAVIDMVKRLVADAPEKVLDDEYDAIAVAVTALAHHR